MESRQQPSLERTSNIFRSQDQKQDHDLAIVVFMMNRYGNDVKYVVDHDLSELQGRFTNRVLGLLMHRLWIYTQLSVANIRGSIREAMERS
jgi:hypothetical protein